MRYRAPNRVFVVLVNGVPLPNVYTSLRTACAGSGIGYETAKRGFKGSFVRKGYAIYACDVIKIKGRGKGGLVGRY